MKAEDRKSIGVSKIVLSLALAACAMSAAPAQAKQNLLAASVAPWVKSAQLVGPAADNQTVKLAFYLGFSHQAELDSLAKSVSTPGNPMYGHYLTPAQFRAEFAPDPAKVAQLRSALVALGFKVGDMPASGLFIKAKGTVAQVKAAFAVSQNLYQFRGKTLRANAEAPTLPSELAGLVRYVGGLDESGRLMTPKHVGIDKPRKIVGNALPQPDPSIPSPFCSKYYGDTVATVSPAPTPYSASVPWLNCGYVPKQMRTAYGANGLTLDGTGVTVAIVDAFASPTILSDANTYASRHSLPALVETGPTPNFVEDIPTDIYNVSASDPGGPQGWYVEESLDVESVHSFAPGANILYVGASEPDDNLFYADYSVIDGDYPTYSTSPASIITNSWGDNGEYSSAAELAVTHAMYEQAVAEGISVLFSSGDDGDLTQDNGVVSGSYPATDTAVTAVGGTSLALTNNMGTKKEWGWGTYRAYLPGAVTNGSGTAITITGAPTADDFSFYSGSGGGLSFSFAQPDYQAAVVPASLSDVTYSESGEPIPFDTPRRVTPDIAMDADPYTGFLMGISFTETTAGTIDPGCFAIPNSTNNTEYCEFGEGGTSLSSPSFAGVLALVNQQRATNTLAPIGFVNPRLYAITPGAPGSTTSALVDVLPPNTPKAVLRGYVTNANVRLVTMNSGVNLNSDAAIEGLDDEFFLTAAGYDPVTGLGTPYVPALVTALGSD